MSIDFKKLLEIANIVKSSNGVKQIGAHHICNALQIMNIYEPNIVLHKVMANCTKIVDEYEKNSVLPDIYNIVKSYIETINTKCYKLTLNGLLYICGLYIHVLDV